MRDAMEETERRRAKQVEYNEAHGITPTTIRKSIRTGIETELEARRRAKRSVEAAEPEIDASELESVLEGEMLEAAEALKFEEAARLRDQLGRVREMIAAAGDGEVVMLRRAEVEQALAAGKRRPKGGKPGTKRGRQSRRFKNQ